MALLAACVVWCAASVSAQVADIPDRATARRIVGQIVSETNKAIDNGRAGQIVMNGMSVRTDVVDDCFAVIVTLPDFEIGSEEGARQLLRYTMACNARDKGERGAVSAKMLGALLEAAEYNVKAMYGNDNGPVLTVDMKPSEYVALYTKPIDSIGVDKNVVLNELIEQMDKAVQTSAADGDLADAGARLDGRYITLHMASSDFDAMIHSGVSEDKLKQVILDGIYAEMGTDFYLKTLSRLGKELKLLGMKFDLKSPTGAEKILNYGWSEFDGYSRTDVDVAKAAMDAYIESANSAMNSDYLASQGVIDAYMAYNEPYIEMVYLLDASDEHIAAIDNPQTRLALWRTVSDKNNVDCMKRMEPIGLKGQRFIYMNSDGAEVQITFTLDQIYGGAPESIPDEEPARSV